MLESRISLIFEELQIPLFEDKEEWVIDLKYENSNYRFNYPLEEGYIFPIKDPYKRDTNRIMLTILMKIGNKLKKIARGEINLYKRYFLKENKSIEKWIFLRLFETQLEDMGHSTDIIKTILNTGKIYCKALLIDSAFEEFEKKNKMKTRVSLLSVTSKAPTVITQILKNTLKNLPNIKENVKHIKTERFRSVTEHENEFLRNLKNKKNMFFNENLYEDLDEPAKKTFDDNLSDVSIEIINEDLQEDNEIDIQAENQEKDLIINELREVYTNEGESKIPVEEADIRKYMGGLKSFIDQTSLDYTNNLKNLDEMNKELKSQAKEYYEKYKGLKETFNKDRLELKDKKEKLDQEIKKNQEQSAKLKNNHKNDAIEYEYVKEKVGIEDDEEEDEDIQIMTKIISSLGVDINTINNLTNEEKEIVQCLLTIKSSYDADNNGVANIEENEVEYNLSEDDESKLIIINIEDIVNSLFNEKLIRHINISQVTGNEYEFDGLFVKLAIENNILIVDEEKKISFRDWVLNNFSNQREKIMARGSLVKSKLNTQYKVNGSSDKKVDNNRKSLNKNQKY